jgi:hypothetical protein
MVFLSKYLGNGKTLLGWLGGIATFTLIIVKCLQDGFQFGDLEIIIGGFSALLVTLGLGHKAERILEGLKK